MRLVRKYWYWNEKLNQTPFKLGARIDDLEGSKLVDKKSIDKYTASKEKIKFLLTSDRKIEGVFFKDEYDLFNVKNIWELEIRDFVKVVDEILIPADENAKGDILFVIFRGGFVSSFSIVRKPIN